MTRTVLPQVQTCRATLARKVTSATGRHLSVGKGQRSLAMRALQLAENRHYLLGAGSKTFNLAHLFREMPRRYGSPIAMSRSALPCTAVLRYLERPGLLQHAGGIVLPEFKRNTNIGVGVGIVLQIAGKIRSHLTFRGWPHIHLGLWPICQSQGLFTVVWFARTPEHCGPYCAGVFSRQTQRRVATRARSQGRRRACSISAMTYTPAALSVETPATCTASCHISNTAVSWRRLITLHPSHTTVLAYGVQPYARGRMQNTSTPMCIGRTHRLIYRHEIRRTYRGLLLARLSASIQCCNLTITV
jgi:hypothetical protein